MNSIILPPAMGKWLGSLASLVLIRQPVLEKEYSEFEPIKVHLKIDLVSHPAHEGGVGKYVHAANYLNI